MNKFDSTTWRKTISNNHIAQSEAQSDPATVQATVEKRVIRFVEPEKEKPVPTETRTVRFVDNLEVGESRTVRYLECPDSPERKVIFREAEAPSKVQKASADNKHQCGAKPTESASVPPLINLITPPPSPHTPPTPPASPVSPAQAIPTAPPPPVISRPSPPSHELEDFAPVIWIEFDDDENQDESDSDSNEAQEESDSELKIVKVESLQGKEAEKFI